MIVVDKSKKDQRFKIFIVINPHHSAPVRRGAFKLHVVVRYEIETLFCHNEPNGLIACIVHV